MSLPPTKFTCTGCDYSGAAYREHEPRMYALPSGAHLRVSWQHGWCEQCAAMRPVELLAENDALKQLAEAEQAFAWLPARPAWRWWQLHKRLFYPWWRREVAAWERAEFSAQSAMADARDLIAMLRARQTGAKCLACGSTQIQAPARDGGEPRETRQGVATGVVHPACGGEILASLDWDGMRFILKPSVQIYSEEGERLGYHTSHFYLDQIMILNARARGHAIPASVVSSGGLDFIPRFLRKHAD